jgi:hypothetical protein
MSKFKVKILASSFKKGPKTFLKQLFQIFKDKVFGPTFLVFSMKKNEYNTKNIHLPDGFEVESYGSWMEVSKVYRDKIENKLENEYWGNIRWFELGWTFWIGTVKGQPAIVSWTRSGEKCKDFFFPISKSSTLIWQTVTFIEFRGHGLLAVMLNTISKTLFQRGVETVYGSCRNFNYPSVKGILSSGFQLIGHGRNKKLKNTGVYYSKNKLFNLG